MMDALKKVLFVDDEEGVRSSWDRFFSLAGFDVRTAGDGARAIDRLREEAVDVVVSDLKMPGVDGVTLLEWIQEEQPDTPFILVTGYGDEEVERRVRELGAFEYLNKPISPEALSAVVTAAAILHKEGAGRPSAAGHARAAPAAPVEGPAALTVAAEGPATADPLAEARTRTLVEAARAATAAVDRILGLAEDPTEEEVRRKGRLRSGLEVAGSLVVAPILGLAFVVFLPVIGIGAVIWVLAELVWRRLRPKTT